MWGEHAVLAVVPARGGSQGVPRKNLRQVAGRSLIEWTAATIAALPWLDAAVLSTDDATIADHGRAAGLAVPFLRPAELATDRASGVATWRHAWLEAERHFARTFLLSIYLQPTTPLRSTEEVIRTLEVLTGGGWAAATTVAPVPGHFVPEKLLVTNAEGELAFAHEHGALVRNRQEARAYWYRTGGCYAAWRETVVERQEIVERRCAAVAVDGPIVNIDDPFDLELADWLATRDVATAVADDQPSRTD